jgi:hypothetical protein
MKTILLLAGACLASGLTASAQADGPIRVKAGEEVGNAIPVGQRYRYEGFRPGSIKYLSGTVSNGRLNYNLLLGEMQFIDPKGDTLSLAGEITLDHVRVGDDLFYYDPENAYLEVVADFNPVKLARKQMLVMAGNEKEGGYGQSTGTGAIKNYSSYATQNSQLLRFKPKGDLLFNREETFFIVDGNKRAHKARRAGILKVYGRHKKAVEQYLKEQPVDFGQEADLKKLLGFCAQLPQ